MLQTEEIDGTLVFKLEDLWDAAKEWARQNGKTYNSFIVEGVAPL